MNAYYDDETILQMWIEREAQGFADAIHDKFSESGLEEEIGKVYAFYAINLSMRDKPLEFMERYELTYEEAICYLYLYHDEVWHDKEIEKLFKEMREDDGDYQDFE